MSTPDCPPDLAFAADLFDRLHSLGWDGFGISRDAYGFNEQEAYALITETAWALDLPVTHDAAANLYITYPGADRSLPVAMTGSHLDSVPNGGNFDGAAGVVAGLTVFGAWREADYTPPHDVVLMVIRASLGTWFPMSHTGSSAAFGRLDSAALGTLRTDTGRSLAEHLSDCGGDPAALLDGAAHLNPGRIARFCELHIEQGRVLEATNLSVGLVSAVRGSHRYREARILGAYDHSGATARENRRDTVRAFAHLVAGLDQDWAEMEEQGLDITFTIGQVSTDPTRHAVTKIAGELVFSLDMRGLSDRALAEGEARLRRRIAAVAAACGVSVDLGADSGVAPAPMDRGLNRFASDAAARLGIPLMGLASAAEHDAAVFARCGVRAQLIFVRNANGSHNPDEALNLDDFRDGCRILAQILAMEIDPGELERLAETAGHL